MSRTSLLPFQPASMTTAQLAAVSYLARYSGRTHDLYSYQLRRWFTWCENTGLDPLVGIQRAHIELYIRQLGEAGLMASSVTTMMHAVRCVSPTLGGSRASTLRERLTDVSFTVVACGSAGQAARPQERSRAGSGADLDVGRAPARRPRHEEACLSGAEMRRNGISCRNARGDSRT